MRLPDSQDCDERAGERKLCFFEGNVIGCILTLRDPLRGLSNMFS